MPRMTNAKCWKRKRRCISVAEIKKVVSGKMDKKILRQKISKIRDNQTELQINEKSIQIRKKLFSLPEFKQAKIIMFYLSFKSEVETKQMIKEAIKLKKKIVVPVVKKESQHIFISELKNYDRELGKGDYGILCPKGEFINKISPELVDLIVVPGVVFDERGHRLGYGKGFYDKFLHSIKRNVPTVGLSFELQIVEKIPNRIYDVQLDKIITEKRVVHCPGLKNLNQKAKKER